MKTTKDGRVLYYLKTHKHGATNYQLNKITLHYGAVIHRLRKEGHNISTVRLTHGTFKYYLNEPETIDSILDKAHKMRKRIEESISGRRHV